MSKLVTIGIPIYRRLEYLPQVLKIVEEQDYPSIELLVSDNGMNGTKYGMHSKPIIHIHLRFDRILP